MPATATLTLAKGEGRRLADAIAGDDRFAAEAIDVGEVAPGRWRVIVYFDNSDRDLAANLETLATGWRWQVLPETDWVAKSLAGLKPVRAGRFLVYGQHDRLKRRPNDVGLEIEAGQAFGTGHHGSTAGCLNAIEALVKSRRIRNALDLGSGSGILAIALAKLAKARVTASDIDPLATRIARENARLNGVAARVRTVTMPGLPRRLPAAWHVPFDVIVANILAGPLVALAPSIRRHLAPGGAVILSGLLPDQRRRIVATYRAVGLRLVGSRIVAGWATVVMERGAKRPPERRQAHRRRSTMRPDVKAVAGLGRFDRASGGRSRRSRAWHRRSCPGTR